MHAEANSTEGTAVDQPWLKMVREKQTGSWVEEEEDERVRKNKSIGMMEFGPFKPLWYFVFVVVSILVSLLLEKHPNYLIYVGLSSNDLS